MLTDLWSRWIGFRVAGNCIFTGILSMYSYGIARRSIDCFVGSTISFTSIYATGTTGAIQMSTGT
jgi:hypothetical protein